MEPPDGEAGVWSENEGAEIANGDDKGQEGNVVLRIKAWLKQKVNENWGETCERYWTIR